MKLILLLLLISMGANASYNILGDNVAVGDPLKPEIGLSFSVQTKTKSSVPCPKMTEIERDALAVNPIGSCIYNLDSLSYQVYDGATWGSLGAGAGIPKWVTGTSYPIDAVVFDELTNKIYRATTAHMAGATFAGDIANWQELSEASLTADETLLQKLDVSTGLVDGGQLSVGAPTSTFNIAAGFGYVVDTTTDPENPTNVRVDWLAQTNVVLTNIAANFTTIGIDSAGLVVQKVGAFLTPEELRDVIALGILVHVSHAQVDSITHNPRMATSIGLSVNDLASSIGSINREGNVFSPNGVNLSLNRSAGETHALGTNYAINPKSPNIRIDTAAIALGFVPVYQDGLGGTAVQAPTTFINPDSWDDGTGVIAVVGNNKYSVQRFFYGSSTSGTFVAYGQQEYANLEAAKNGIVSENFIVPPALLGASLRGWLILKKGETDLNNSVFINADRFGSSPISGGTPALGDLQGAYDNSIAPQIVVDAVRGGMQVTDAATPTAAPLFEILTNSLNTLVNYFTVAATNISTELDIIMNGTGQIKVPSGVTGERSVTPTDGMFRYNTTNSEFEGYAGAWGSIGGSPNTTQGDIMVYGVTEDERLAIGTAGQTLFSNGSTANWGDPNSLGLLGKGGLLTSNGLTNGEFTACADGQSLEYNAAAIDGSGLECVTVASYISPTTTLGDMVYNDGGGNGSDVRVSVGTPGQLMTNVAGIPAFADAPISTTLATKGDLQGFSTVNAALPVGVDGATLVADSTQPLGVGYSTYLQGTLNAISDWEDCTVDGSWVSNTIYTCKKKRIGDEVEFNIKLTITGAVSAGTMSVNLPTGMVIDTAKLTNVLDTTDNLGRVFINDASSTNFSGVVLYQDTTTVRVESNVANGVYLYTDPINQNVPIPTALGDFYILRFTVPIVGLTNGYDGVVQNKTLAFVETKGGVGSPLANAAIPFTEVKDTKNVWNGTQLVVAEDGRYVFDGSMSWTSSVIRYVYAYVNRQGAGFVQEDNVAYNETSDTFSFNTSIDLLAGDILEFRDSTNGGTILNDTKFHRMTITQNQESKIQAASLPAIADRCQTKTLSVTATTNIVLTDLGFANLDITKLYSFSSHLVLSHTSASSNQKSVSITVSGIGASVQERTAASFIFPTEQFNEDIGHNIPASPVTATSLTLTVSGITNTSIVAGSTATLCYKGNTVTTTEF